MIYKIKIPISQGPFWLFEETEPGWMEMYCHKGSKVSLWVKTEVFHKHIEDGTYKVIEILEG